jgi:hypothetical protein
MTVFCVAGLGRCGSSLTMQMLAAGGLLCVGSFPDFEVDEVNNRPVDRAWFAAQDGKALKWLAPHETPVPHDVPKAVIWLTRDHEQQARSQYKLLRSAFTIVKPPSRRDVRAMASTLHADERRIWKSLERAPATFRFEELLRLPHHSAERIARFVATWGGPTLDVDAMAAAVIDRPPHCLPHRDIEAQLVSRGR